MAWPSTAAVDKAFEVVGDYNGDRTVDAADYVLWANQNGQVGPNLSADGDDDGDVDANDYAIWSQNFGHTLTISDIA